MKKIISITLVAALAITLVAMGSTKAEAGHNEAAALLTAGFVLVGLHALSHNAAYYEPVYVYGPPPRYIERTEIIYVEPRYKKYWKKKNRAYDRGYRREWKRLDHKRGRHDARHEYRRTRYR